MNESKHAAAEVMALIMQQHGHVQRAAIGPSCPSSAQHPPVCAVPSGSSAPPTTRCRTASWHSRCWREGRARPATCGAGDASGAAAPCCWQGGAPAAAAAAAAGPCSATAAAGCGSSTSNTSRGLVLDEPSRKKARRGTPQAVSAASMEASSSSVLHSSCTRVAERARSGQVEALLSTRQAVLQPTWVLGCATATVTAAAL